MLLKGCWLYLLLSLPPSGWLSIKQICQKHPAEEYLCSLRCDFPHFHLSYHFYKIIKVFFFFFILKLPAPTKNLCLPIHSHFCFYLFSLKFGYVYGTFPCVVVCRGSPSPFFFFSLPLHCGLTKALVRAIRSAARSFPEATTKRFKSEKENKTMYVII